MSEINYSHLLEPGEAVETILPAERLSQNQLDPEQPLRPAQEWLYGNGYAAIQDSTHHEGNSVILAIEPPEDVEVWFSRDSADTPRSVCLRAAMEPVLITEDITLSVRALQGRGRAVIYNTDSGAEVRTVAMAVGSEPLRLGHGDAYYYVNTGEDELVLRDDCTPAFQGHEELSLTAVPQAEGGRDGRTIPMPPAFWLGFAVE